MKITDLKNIAKKSLLVFGVGALLFAAVPAITYADPASDACEGIKAAGGTCDTSGAGADSLKPVIQSVIEILSIVAGAVAVIMIIIGGLRYILANGDSNAVSGAKNTILYAVIGLVIVLFARVIVSFVFTTAQQTSSQTQQNQNNNDNDSGESGNNNNESESTEGGGSESSENSGD